MAASTIIAGVGAAGALAGGIGSAVNASGARSAASSAGATEAAAANQAAQLQYQQYLQEREDLAPWRTAGTGAVNYLSGMLVPNAQGQLTTDPTNALRATPGYQFAQNQGVNALELGAASRGNLLSGAQQKGLETFGQGLADNTYQNYLNNLFTVSGEGQNAAATTGAAGMNYANQAGTDYMAAAQAQAQATMNAYNAQQSGYGNLAGSAGMATALLNNPAMRNYLSPSSSSGYGGGFNALSDPTQSLNAAANTSGWYSGGYGGGQ